MATRQYIGARYVPKFYQNSVDGSTQWEANVVYDPLIYVTLTNGHMYISKKQVPATVGTPASNAQYWLDIGSYNGFIEELQDEINALSLSLTALDNSVVKMYATVADMVADTSLTVGEMVATLGYYAINDGGDGKYIIKSTSTGIYETITGGLVAELQFTDSVNVLQVGAKGDGVTDDLTAFTKAITNAERIIVPRGNDKTYKLSNSISLGIRQTLVSDMEQSTASFPLLDFASGGIIITGRNVTIDGVAIKTTSSNDGIAIGTSGGSSLPHIAIKNCYIYNSANGINTVVNAWQFLVESVRFVSCVTGFRLIDCGPCVTLVNCYFDGCTQHTLYATDSRFSATGCNFGIMNNSNVYNDRNNAIFTDCNFECDETIANAMIRANGRQLRFENCKFGVNGTTGCCVFATSAGLWGCVLENCIIGYQGASAGEGYKPPLVDVDYFTAYSYGAFVIGKGCENLPRFTPYDAQKPMVIDLCKDGLMHFSGTTIDKTKLSVGTMLFSNAQNKICYFDGTNVVTVDDNTVVV